MKNLPTIIFWVIIIFSVIKSFMKQSKQSKNAPGDNVVQPGQRRIDYKIPKFMDILIDAEDFSTPLESNIREERKPEIRLTHIEEEVKQSLPEAESKDVIPAPVIDVVQTAIRVPNELISGIRSSLRKKDSLQQAFLMSEILQKPKALRHRVHG